MELYIIRHAQSTNNVLTPEYRHLRVADAPLTGLGQSQAAVLARHLATGLNPGPPADALGRPAQTDYRISRLYCSAMWRSLHTARFIADALERPPEVWLDPHEHGGVYLDHGEPGGKVGYPGKTRGEILAEFPGCLLPEGITDEGWWRSGYEDWPACCARALRVARTLRRWAETDERITIVSHGGFINALLKALFNLLPSRELFFHHYNTGITRLDFYGDGRVGVRYLNRSDHLPPELISL